MLRAILYAFIPSHQHNMPSLEHQQAKNREYANHIGADIVEECNDSAGSSTSLLLRSGWKEVSRALETGRANCVICYSEDVVERTRALSIARKGAELHYSTSGKVDIPG